jgi:O-antigen/teichoic acid export membrane protein
MNRGGNHPATAEKPDGGDSAAPLEERRLSLGEVRRRAVTGAAVDVMRGFGVRLLGLVGTLVLARLLTPHDFGIIAVGVTFVTFANFFADGGIGAGLIRRIDPPAQADLRALLAFQLGLSTALAVGISVVMLPFGEMGQVTALMMIALPLTALRAPGVIMLERQLSYRALALVEIVETILYYGSAIVLVIYGLGIWGLACASVVRALTGSIVLLLLVPSARLIPYPSWAKVRPLLRFGFQIQAVGVTNLLRDQGTNLVIAVVAGVSALGVWSIAFRIVQIPLVFLSSLWRVSYPGMSRLVAEEREVGETIERIVAVVAVFSGLMLAPLVAATPAWVPALLGDQWTEAVPVIPPACLHLMVIGPISVALIGYLWALGEASAVLRATVVGIPLMAAVMIPLLFVIGAPAVGFGWLASAIGEATVLILAARKHAEFSIKPHLFPPTILAVLAASIGWFVSSEAGTTLIGGAAGGAFAVAVYILGLWIWHRSDLIDSVHLSVRGLRNALRTSAVT